MGGRFADAAGVLDNLFFDKKNWRFPGRDFVLMAVSVGMIGFIYIKEVVYTPVIIWNVFYLDPILFSTILGMLLFIYSQKFYQWMKARNGGHAHFPFEKVVLPVVWLLAASVFSLIFPFRCKEMKNEKSKRR